MTNPAHLPAPLGGTRASRIDNAADVSWVRRIAEVLNRTQRGQLNAVTQVTLTTASTTTTVTDARIGYYSGLFFSPTTQAAAAIMGSLYVSSKQEGSATLTHLRTGDTCSFDVAILG